MTFQDSLEKYKLIAKVESSESDEKTENDVNSALKEAADILKSVRKTWNKVLLAKFEREQKELEISIMKSLAEDKKITKDELIEIKLELSDIIKLAEKNNIGETTSLFSKWTNRFTWADNNIIKKGVRKISGKDINGKWSKNEAKIALEHLNKEYFQTNDGSMLDVDKFINFEDKNINQLDDKREFRIFQEKLINIFLWNDKWYNDEYVLWFSKEKGNYLVKISDYKNKINNNEDLWWESTATFLLYLNEKFPNETDFLKNVRIIFWEKFKKIWPFLQESKSKRKTKALNVLEKYWIVKNWNFILDFITDTINKFKRILWSFNDFITYLKNPNANEINELIDYLKDNDKLARTLLRHDLLDKFANIDNKEEIVDKLLDNLLDAIKNKNIWIALSILDKTLNDNNVNISNLELTWTIEKANNIVSIDEKITFFKAQQNWDKEWMVVAESNLIKYESYSIFLKNITEEQVTEVITRTNAWESFGDIVKDIKKVNNKLNDKLISYENSLYTLEEKDYKYSWDWDSFLIKIPGLEEVTITGTEKNLTIWNPEATKDLINFYTTLKKVWLSNLWQYREQISNAIWSISGSNLNYSDLLWENELKIFLNSILLSVWKKEIDKNKNIEEFTNLFKSENDFQVVWEWFKNDSIKKWSSNIEEIFFKKYILGYPNFQVEKFKNEIQKKN